ncbi:MAG: WGR domain-containing protein, partial [Gammaproteobacteria bacterium]|nr:WGR domain-containing protein [Gammaproteobacteria bacterium]
MADRSTPGPPSEPWITRCWERDRRYYTVRLQQDLWGGWVITLAWGRRGSALGRVVDQPCANYAEGLALLEQIGRRRRQQLLAVNVAELERALARWRGALEQVHRSGPPDAESLATHWAGLPQAKDSRQAAQRRVDTFRRERSDRNPFASEFSAGLYFSF